MALALTTAQKTMLEQAAAAEDGMVALRDGFQRRTAKLLHDMGLGDAAFADHKAAAALFQQQGFRAAQAEEAYSNAFH